MAPLVESTDAPERDRGGFREPSWRRPLAPARGPGRPRSGGRRRAGRPCAWTDVRASSPPGRAMPLSSSRSATCSASRRAWAAFGRRSSFSSNWACARCRSSCSRRPVPFGAAARAREATRSSASAWSLRPSTVARVRALDREAEPRRGAIHGERACSAAKWPDHARGRGRPRSPGRRAADEQRATDPRFDFSPGRTLSIHETMNEAWSVAARRSRSWAHAAIETTSALGAIGRHERRRRRAARVRQHIPDAGGGFQGDRRSGRRRGRGRRDGGSPRRGGRS